LITLVLLAACASQKTKEEPQPAPAPVAPTPVVTPAPAVTAPVVQNPLHDPSNILYKHSVYFGYDKYEVTSEFQPLVTAHAKYLRDHSGAKVAIQGNCDERGSREYNIALGQRRADTVKRMMQLYGATDAQIETVSFGKEKPKNAGHDEAAWAENRRDDMVYAGE